MKNSSIFVAFLENMNFTEIDVILLVQSAALTQTLLRSCTLDGVVRIFSRPSAAAAAAASAAALNTAFVMAVKYLVGKSSDVTLK